ncbi:hypothetical protein DOTSEDRAFT_68771 [Dothistroma septosporum NZE10]|uniref:Uncharacterized protein n=1 Tax=Dothistroma septosporum (strain NZE10 / CBS 128990) TaxID=675120 RepID=N1Q2W5_DOTSN|nr:hypothetical protein DOTSEDRAFT_68771 [Dothistroma septosporum NZE10]
MSFDAGGLAQMTYNNNGNGFPSTGLGVPGSGFGARGTRHNTKRLSVALPPRVPAISENQVDNPTPRTSRSHLLAGLRTQPKTPAVPASAPYHQSHHSTNGPSASRWADQQNFDGYTQGVPQTAIGAGFDLRNHYAQNAARQIYSLPEQVLAPPAAFDQVDEMDPVVLQQMQMQRLYLAQRQQQLQQQLASLTAAAQSMSINGNMRPASFHQGPMTPQTPQSFYGQQQIQSPIEVPGQPGVYLVYNPAIQGYAYAVDPGMQQAQQSMSPVSQHQGNPFSPANSSSPVNGFGTNSSVNERATPTSGRSFTPPKKAPSPPSSLEHVQPLPPPSATAFRRGHKKASSLAINAFGNVADGPKTSSVATFGSQRVAFPPTPMTGTFGPGAARAGEHPIRQPRGPPPLEELTAAPTTKHEGSKNFATRRRRRALDSLMKAGTQRRGVSQSSGGSPVSERECNFPIHEEAEDGNPPAGACRKMSPIGSEMKEKRGSQGSDGGYFGLSSASSSEGEDFGTFKQPPTPATPGAPTGDRKKMMLDVLNAAEKRRSYAI